MERKTVSRSELADCVFRRVGLSRTESAALVEMVLAEICAAIERGENVMLATFATFQVREKRERIGRNPKTGEETLVSQRRVVVFKASQILKDRVSRAHLRRMRKIRREGTMNS